ncbi:MAG: STAS domain-containing protein [Acidobacteriia bacterium]|nr:STAS domain-containing protein [Terriglobia bacterium]
MSVKLNTRQVGNVSVIEVAGRITLGEGSSALRDAVNGMLAKDQKNIVVNLGEVPYVDSSGIGELVSAFSSVKKSGGQLKLSNLTKRVKDLLRISRHDLIFEIHEDEAAALQSFA